MPKLKTHKGAQARLHITGTGKILRMKGHRSHLRRKKHAKVRRLYSTKLSLHPSQRRRVQKLVPNLGKGS